jgi:hypothetical protein
MTGKLLDAATHRKLTALYEQAKRGDRRAARDGLRICQAAEAKARARRRWRCVRAAVVVRPYILHWLEQAAMGAEEERIARARRGVVDDPIAAHALG